LAQQFREQGGAATMDPSPLLRFLTSKLVTRVAGPARLERSRARAEKARLKAGRPHRVEYFHQVEDGYSHLAAQLLRPLLERYDVELACHLVAGPSGRNVPEPELLLDLARADSAAVAPHYGLQFPGGTAKPDPGLVDLASRILAASDDTDFPERAIAVGNALWSADGDAMNALADRHGVADDATAAEALRSGTARREKLGHYSSAMFYYGGEWYWGVDRLYHLENRLAGLEARRDGSSTMIAPRPPIENGPLRDDGSLTLEVYPSLRSPYTSIIFERTLELARATGVRLVVRPVLPMVMRGVPATRQKGFYIFSDTAREARALGLDWGNFYDPIGDPVRRCYSLYPWACAQGKGNELLEAFLRAAFFDGVNTNNDRGMRTVVLNAGLDWQEAQAVIDDSGWQEEIEANRLAMYGFGSWGVPSYRLLDTDGSQVMALWGQDRLWLFSREIQRLLARRAA
jgi:2-hydroxychromene-2-carboxylate isomerase